MFGWIPLILGRPWLENVHAYIGCISRYMTLSDGCTAKNLVLYPSVKQSVKIENPSKFEFELEEMDTRIVLAIIKALQFKSKTKYDVINNFISDPSVITSCTSKLLNDVIDESNMKEPLDDIVTHDIPTTSSLESVPVEIEHGKNLNINPNLFVEQKEELVLLLRKYKKSFT